MFANHEILLEDALFYESLMLALDPSDPVRNRYKWGMDQALEQAARLEREQHTPTKE